MPSIGAASGVLTAAQESALARALKSPSTPVLRCAMWKKAEDTSMEFVQAIAQQQHGVNSSAFHLTQSYGDDGVYARATVKQDFIVVADASVLLSHDVASSLSIRATLVINSAAQTAEEVFSCTYFVLWHQNFVLSIFFLSHS